MRNHLSQIFFKKKKKKEAEINKSGAFPAHAGLKSLLVAASSESRPAVFGLSRHLTAGQENRKYDISALTFRNVGMSGCLFTPLERNRGSGVDAADQLPFFLFSFSSGSNFHILSPGTG